MDVTVFHFLTLIMLYFTSNTKINLYFLVIVNAISMFNWQVTQKYTFTVLLVVHIKRMLRGVRLSR